MTLEVISSEDAWSTAYRNKFARYPTLATGIERLYPLPAPKVRGSFKIPRGSRIFSIGSCFAGALDVALQSAGFNVTSRSDAVLAKVKDRDNVGAIFNKYTIQSVLNEVRWALDPEHPHPGAEALFEMAGEKWTDLHLGGGAGYFNGTLDDMLALRAAYSEAMKTIVDADVVILTIGLAESWFDKKLGLALNTGPTLQIADAWPERFEFRTHHYNDILETLETIHALIRRFGNPDCRFLLAVDPVPQIMTYRNMDVVVANGYSKSLLRAVAEEFVMKHDDVDYFPSYEFVFLGDPKLACASDCRHVSSIVVRSLVANLIAQYLPSDELKAIHANEDVKTLYRAGDYSGVIEKAKGFGYDKLESATLNVPARERAQQRSKHR